MIKAAKDKYEQKIWNLWLQLYPHMVVPNPQTKDGKPIIAFKSFEEFKEKLERPVSTKSKEEILEDVRKIRTKLGR